MAVPPKRYHGQCNGDVRKHPKCLPGKLVVCDNCYSMVDMPNEPEIRAEIVRRIRARLAKAMGGGASQCARRFDLLLAVLAKPWLYLLWLYSLPRCARRFDVCAHVRGINVDIGAADPASTSTAKRKTWTTPLWAERDSVCRASFEPQASRTPDRSATHTCEPCLGQLRRRRMPEAWWHHATALAAAARGAPANATPATLLVHTNALEATVATFAARPQDLVRAAVAASGAAGAGLPWDPNAVVYRGGNTSVLATLSLATFSRAVLTLAILTVVLFSMAIPTMAILTRCSLCSTSLPSAAMPWSSCSRHSRASRYAAALCAGGCKPMS